MRKGKKQPPPPDLTHVSTEDSVDNTMMDLLLEMSSQMQVMEEFVAQHNNPILIGNQGQIPERRRDNAQLDDAAATSSARFAAGHLESSCTIAPRIADGRVPETVRGSWPSSSGKLHCE